jgi:hypothetical protein
MHDFLLHTSIVQAGPCKEHGGADFLPVTRFEEAELDDAIKCMSELGSDLHLMSVFDSDQLVTGH